MFLPVPFMPWPCSSCSHIRACACGSLQLEYTVPAFYLLTHFSFCRSVHMLSPPQRSLLSTWFKVVLPSNPTALAWPWFSSSLGLLSLEGSCFFMLVCPLPVEYRLYKEGENANGRGSNWWIKKLRKHKRTWGLESQEGMKYYSCFLQNESKEGRQEKTHEGIWGTMHYASW